MNAEAPFATAELEEVVLYTQHGIKSYENLGYLAYSYGPDWVEVRTSTQRSGRMTQHSYRVRDVHRIEARIKGEPIPAPTGVPQ